MPHPGKPFAGQIPLPLTRPGGAVRIVVGPANEGVLDACNHAASWPFRTALLWGEPRSGKSLIARWFAANGLGDAIDDAQTLDEDAIFHRWNRAQEAQRPLLIIGPPVPDGWKVSLPDLGSRLGAALNLRIDPPGDTMIEGLIEAHAEARGLALADGATTYLVPRAPRSFAGIEALVAEIDRISLERKVPATLAVWREALDTLGGGGMGEQGDLL
ncbi:ATPase [Croceicoccus marinus]|jgi:hypothetical protein|uniref:ATPase n=1 Tax=Croceicoccus marinus TaxID=450378 RepID=A0A7G6VW19_9SPHN|nr:ATPase [Croceicoccus marinus]QNE05934.1 ATPase [Croceicoccus marinus]